jgi:hypothetical protein
MGREKKRLSMENPYGTKNWYNSSSYELPLKRDLDTKVVAITDKLKKLNLINNNDIKNIVTKDIELLKSICAIPGQSRKTSKISTHIIELIEVINKSNPKADINVNVDSLGNICVTKKSTSHVTTFPTYVSHIDTVHRHTETPKILLTNENTLIAYLVSGNRVEQVGVGGDDRVGVFCCIKALELLPDCKAVFFVDEEIGCVGSNGVDMNFFNDSRFVVQLDRRGNTDFINFTNGYEVSTEEFTKEFLENINFTDNSLYSKSQGTVTDVGTLRKRGLQVASCNLSCGYYEAHCSTEYIDVYDCLLAVYSSISFAAISNKVYEFPKVVKNTLLEDSNLSNTDLITPFTPERISNLAKLSELTLKSTKSNICVHGLKLDSSPYSIQFNAFAVGVVYGLGYDKIIGVYKKLCTVCNSPIVKVKDNLGCNENVCIGCFNITL